MRDVSSTSLSLANMIASKSVANYQDDLSELETLKKRGKQGPARAVFVHFSGEQHPVTADWLSECVDLNASSARGCRSSSATIPTS
jgi:hypothetical protein